MQGAQHIEEMTMFHLKRRVRAVVANVVDTMAMVSDRASTFWIMPT
jgi:hypothetical protein